MKSNQIYVNGIITNCFRLGSLYANRVETFIKELTTLAVLLVVVVALAIVIQPI
jgi:hypothetical protein